MLHGAVHLALDHSVELALGGVDGDDDDVLTGLQSGSLNGLNSAQSHIAVAGEENIDLVPVGLQEGLHDLHALGTGVLTGLGTDDVVLAAVGGFGHGIVEALQAVGGHGGADRALQNRHLELIAAGTGSLALSSHILVNPIEGIGTLLQGVGKDVGHIQRGVRSHAAVHQDHRDPGVLGLLQDRIPAGLHDGAEGDHIHVRCDEGADGLDLVLLLLLCVGELEGHAGGLRGSLDVVGVGSAPLALRTDLGKSKGDAVLTAGIGAFRASITAGGQRQGHRSGQNAGQPFLQFHTFQSFLAFFIFRMGGLAPCVK